MIEVSEDPEASDGPFHVTASFTHAATDALIVDRFRLTLQEAGALLDPVPKSGVVPPSRSAVNPPPAPAILLGRAAVLDAARALRPQAAARRLALVGPAGSGKSALLRALANDAPFLSNFDDVVYVCAGTQPVADVVSQIFAALHVRANPRYLPTSTAWLDRAIERDLAVLVDDADAPFDVATLAAVLPHATLVIASNDPVPGFPWQPLSPLAPEDALWLLCSLTTAGPFAQDAARMLSDTFYGNPARLRQIATLSAVSGNSLIELAGNIRSSMMLDDMLVTAVAQLDARKRALFDAIFVFGAAAALGDDPEALELATSGSIVPDGDGWRLAPGLEARFAKRTIDAPAFASAMQSCGTRLSDHLRAIDDPSRLQRTLAAVRRAAELERWGDAIAIGRALSDAFARCGAWEQWKHTLDFIATLAAHEGSETLQAWVQHQSGTRAACLGDASEAKSLLREALNRRKNAGDESGAEATKHNLDLLGAFSKKQPVAEAAPAEPAPPAPVATEEPVANDPPAPKNSNARRLVAGGAVLAALIAGFFLVPLGRPQAQAPAVIAQATPSTAPAPLAKHHATARHKPAAHGRPRPAGPPASLAFSGVPAPAKPGEAVQVCYHASGLRALSLDPERGSVRPSGAACVEVHPAATTIYVLRGTTADGHALQRELVVAVATPEAAPSTQPSSSPSPAAVALAPHPSAPPRLPAAAAYERPQIVAFGASRQLVSAGGSATLCMDVKHATRVRLNAVSDGRQSQLPVPAAATRGASGCIRITPKASTRYTLVASSPAGQSYRVTAVDVFSTPPPAPAPGS